MSVAAIVVAAGAGQRLGAALPKALVLLHGRPLFEWAATAIGDHSDVCSMVLVVPESEQPAIAAALSTIGHCPVTVVAGGATRQLSVQRGLAALADDVEFVLVHDAARPLIPAEVIDRVVSALRAGAPAVIPVIEVTDTIKTVAADATVTATLDRSRLRAVQTPQGFRRSVLKAAHDHISTSKATGADARVTDDAGMVEATGLPVLTVAGSHLAFKITTPHDLLVAEALVLGKQASSASAADFGQAT